MADWQRQLARVITSIEELCACLQVKPEQLAYATGAQDLFALRVPQAFVERMEVGNPDDPLLRQVLPGQQELMVTPGYTADPLQESEYNPVPGLLHKYHGRVLVTLSGGCAIHCRYCFRRHFPYNENTPGRSGLEKIIHYIEQDNSIEEVILSGGDPLLIKDSLFAKFVERFDSISHLQRLRIHTRLPIVIPDRVTNELITRLTQSRLKPVIVVHCNHAQEINNAVQLALQKLHRNGMTLLNQAVLLKGVNDNIDAQINLSKQLFNSNVMPYYLHLADKVASTAHFDVDEQTAKIIYKKMQASLPGYLVPKLVREVAGENNKLNVN